MNSARMVGIVGAQGRVMVAHQSLSIIGLHRLVRLVSIKREMLTDALYP